MDDRTLKALQGSIDKWERIVIGTELDRGPDNCPLCHEFNKVSGCDGCPVAEKTGLSWCAGSPYIEYVRVPSKYHAQAEVDFLKSLLPRRSEMQTVSSPDPALECPLFHVLQAFLQDRGKNKFEAYRDARMFMRDYWLKEDIDDIRKQLAIRKDHIQNSWITLTCDDRLDLARRIADNLGYKLVRADGAP